MRREEAYKILGLQNNANEDEIKKSFRKLAMEHHPDKNAGSKESEEKFKEINQAYQILTNKEKADDDMPQHSNPFQGQSPFGGFGNIEDIFNFMNNPHGSPFESFFNDPNIGAQRRRQNIDLSPINIAVNLTFEECVLGCTKQIKYQRKIYCNGCDGLGKAKENSKQCNKCKGSGKYRTRIGNGFMVTMTTHTCDMCAGSGFTGDKCNQCSGNGYNNENVTLNVKVPAIGGEEARLGINGKGNMFNETVGDVFLHLFPTIKGEGIYNGMELIGRDVHARVSVNLDKLLFGGNIKVPVVGDGDKEIHIKKLTKPGDIYTIKNFGARKHANFEGGKHIIIVDINYPDKLTDDLREELVNSYKK